MPSGALSILWLGKGFVWGKSYCRHPNIWPQWQLGILWFGFFGKVNLKENFIASSRIPTQSGSGHHHLNIWSFAANFSSQTDFPKTNIYVSRNLSIVLNLSRLVQVVVFHLSMLWTLVACLLWWLVYNGCLSTLVPVCSKHKSYFTSWLQWWLVYTGGFSTLVAFPHWWLVFTGGLSVNVNTGGLFQT